MTNNISYNNVWDKSGNIRELVLIFNTNKSLSSVALEILDLNKRGFIDIPRSATQKTIETNISSAIAKVKPTPTVTPDTDKKFSCKGCGGGRGLCIFGGCFNGKGITWRF